MDSRCESSTVRVLQQRQSDGDFDRGSFYFRVAEWTEDEMYDRALSVAEKSVYYYFSKLGKEAFLR